MLLTFNAEKYVGLVSDKPNLKGMNRSKGRQEELFCFSFEDEELNRVFLLLLTLQHSPSLLGVGMGGASLCEEEHSP